MFSFSQTGCRQCKPTLLFNHEFSGKNASSDGFMPTYGNLGEIERNQLRTRTGKLDSTFRGDDRRKKDVLVSRWGRVEAATDRVFANKQKRKKEQSRS